MVDVAAPNLGRLQRIHVVGVGGAGMSAIATVLAAMGHTVSGSDLKDGRPLDFLRAAGLDVSVGHAASNVGQADLVTFSTAVPASNAELTEAGRRGIPCLTRAQMLSALCLTRTTVAVSGTHGKTTTASMLALILVEAGLKPSFIIGGELNEAGTGAVWEGGDLFVVEADESDGTFLALKAEAVVVTSVEADHLDRYGSLDNIITAFRQFISGANRLAVVCADEPGAAALGRELGSTTYGTSLDADYRISDVAVGRGVTSFAVTTPSGEKVAIELPAPGVHNARNATAALATAHLLGAPLTAAQEALARYGGVARRFQFRGERGGVSYVDDYAHNPGKVRAVLDAASGGGWDRIVCVFQPHLYSRTADLVAEFADAFVGADVLVITDIYGARETPMPGVTGKLLVDAVLANHADQRVAYLPSRPDLAAFLRRELRSGDLCLTLGAGDLTSLPDELLESTF